jgi:hypothetical protein
MSEGKYSLRISFFVVAIDTQHFHPFAIVEVALAVSERALQEFVNLEIVLELC